MATADGRQEGQSKTGIRVSMIQSFWKFTEERVGRVCEVPPFRVLPKNTDVPGLLIWSPAACEWISESSISAVLFTFHSLSLS